MFYYMHDAPPKQENHQLLSDNLTLLFKFS